MKTKSLAFIVLLVIITLFIGTNSSFAGWHEWSQSSRNQAIVNEANSWSDGSYGGQCKVWIQGSVVWEASNYSVWLPTNYDYCSWNYHPYVVGRSAMLNYVQPGEIIQMKLKSANGGGPHTIVITANNGSSITFKESNWCSNNCGLVGHRTLTYSQFYNMVDCYSIYYVM